MCAKGLFQFFQEVSASLLDGASLTHADTAHWLLVLVLLELFSAQVDVSCRWFITVDYFRYHIDDMGEQKETEWSCHDYSDFFLFF